MNTYAIKVQFQGIIRAESMKQFKKDTKEAIFEMMGSHPICRKKFHATGTKLNLSISTIRRILKKEGCI